MGTTVVVVLFYNNMVTIAHVGDSRVYRLRNGDLAQVTNDHSLVQELIDRGFFTPEEAEANTPKNLVTRALGIDENIVTAIRKDVRTWPLSGPTSRPDLPLIVRPSDRLRHRYGRDSLEQQPSH